LQFVETGETTAERDESRADSFICVKILQPYYEDAKSASEQLEKIGDRMPREIRQTLIRRWEQIKVLIRSAFENGINKYTQAHMHEEFDAPNPFL